jgi:hypothetical protein
MLPFRTTCFPPPTPTPFALGADPEEALHVREVGFFGEGEEVEEGKESFE